MARLPQRIALVDQARPLVPFLGVAENIELALAIRGVVGDAARTRTAETLEALGIGESAARRPDELSAGERTRTSLARALASRPDLLLLDEPTATLDRRTAASIAELIAGLPDVTVIAATHDPALPNGRVVYGDPGVNTGYTWQIDPADINWADMTTEVCDGLPSDVEAHAISGDRFCPWSAQVIAVDPDPSAAERFDAETAHGMSHWRPLPPRLRPTAARPG